jgi:hypothetical protein
MRPSARAADAGILTIMSIEGEAAGDALTGAVIAHTVQGRKTGQAGAHSEHGKCLNCGAPLNGAYCSTCGQAAHVHRSLSSIGHDILHGVFHFEGKVWHTLPELFLHPGRLTRRYIDGERAKFVSPMALYLFTVFLMFAIFGMIGGPFPHDEHTNTNINILTKAQTQQTKESLTQAMEELDAEIADIRAKLTVPGLSEEAREDLEANLHSTQTAREGMAAVASGEWGKLTGLGSKTKDAPVAEKDLESGQLVSGDPNVNTGWKALDDRITAGLKEVKDNPRLLLYKLKTNGYKFSWALIPMSLPFLWILFFWRRDVNLYDHAIFITYSITFMMLLVVILSLLNVVHISSKVLGFAVLLIPIHMYKQLRGTYGLSRFGAFGRLIFLVISAQLVLVFFSVALVVVGVMG